MQLNNLKGSSVALKIVFLSVLIAYWNTSLKAEMRVGKFLELISKGDVSSFIYISGVSDGLSWGNIGATYGGRPVYCPPKKSNFSAEYYTEILRVYAQTTPEIREQTVGMALVRAMQTQFPCVN